MTLLPQITLFKKLKTMRSISTTIEVQHHCSKHLYRDGQINSPLRPARIGYKDSQGNIVQYSINSVFNIAQISC